MAPKNWPVDQAWNPPKDGSPQGCRTGIMTSMSTALKTQLAVVGRTSAGHPTTFRLERAKPAASREAAYRRLATKILGLDVRSLAAELASKRSMLTREASAA
jgi:hypothetical protein